jgi:tetratricopeptide (TPR) repeat protein
MRVGGVKRAWNWLLSRFYRRLADAHRHFGNLHADQSEHWAAVGNYTRASLLDPTYTDVYFSRGVLYWREIGNQDRAIQDLSRVLELDPSWADAYFNRALAYRLHNEPEKAVADLERYLEEGRDEYWLESARRQLAELYETLSELSSEGNQGISDGS